MSGCEAGKHSPADAAGGVSASDAAASPAAPGLLDVEVAAGAGSRDAELAALFDCSRSSGLRPLGISPRNFALPKSMSFRWPLASRSKFSGFRSR